MNSYADPTDDWVCSARQAHYRASRLAEIRQISVRQLERQFEETFNRCPQHWLNEVRLLEAALLLSNGTRIKEVAAKLQFPHTAHFSNRFRAYFGCSPSEFVQIHRDRLTERKRKFNNWYPGEPVPSEWLLDPTLLQYRALLDREIKPSNHPSF